MKDQVFITLAGAPRGKQRVKNAADGHAYTPERTVSYEGRLAYAAQIAMGNSPPLEGAIEMDIKFYLPVPKSWPQKKKDAALAGKLRPTCKPDWDNHGKLTDAFNLIVWVDDAQVVDGRSRKWYSDRPRTEILVKPISTEGVFA